MIQRTWQGLCESSVDTDLCYKYPSPNIQINAHRLFHRINAGEMNETIKSMWIDHYITKMVECDLELYGLGKVTQDEGLGLSPPCFRDQHLEPGREGG